MDAEENEMIINDLIIEDQEIELIKQEKKFAIKFKDKIVNNLSKLDIYNILNDNKIRTNAYKEFEGFIHLIDPKTDIERLRNQLKYQLKIFIDNDASLYENKKEDPTIEKQIEIIPNTSFETIKPTELEQIISTILLGAKYKLKNPPWTEILGYSGIGKSTELEKFNDPRLVHWMGRTTKNVFLSGKPNKDAEDPYSVLEASKGKTIIINDASQILGSGEENIKNIIGILTDAYGKKEISIDDPGGRRIIKTWFSVILGLTPLQSYELNKYLNIMGQRFLIRHQPTNWDNYYKDQDDRDKTNFNERKQLLVSHILNTYEKYPKMLKYTDTMVSKALEISKRVVILRNLAWKKFKDNSLTEIEHYQRLMNVLLNCAVLHSMLWNKTIHPKDLDIYIKLAIPTIYRIDLLKEFHIKHINGCNIDENSFFDRFNTEKNKKRGEIVQENLKTLGIYDVFFDSKWDNFFTDYIDNYDEVKDK